jgi:hypothetical protein
MEIAAEPELAQVLEQVAPLNSLSSRRIVPALFIVPDSLNVTFISGDIEFTPCAKE